MTASQSPQGANPDAAREAAPRLARHLARCTPCRDGLDAMSAQKSVLGRMGRGRVAGDGGEHLLVDEVLEACAQDGREKVADLLYEMAHACVHLIPEDLELGEVTKNPDPVESQPIEVLVGPATDVCGRMPGNCLGDQELPNLSPEPAVARNAARSCLALLEQVEGPTARRRFTEAFIAQSEPNHERVISLLTPMYSESLPEWLWLGVRWLLMAAYLRTERPQEAISIGEAALKVCPDDRALIYNTAAAYAEIGDAAAFDRICETLSSSRSQFEDSGWWERVLENESSGLAELLGRDVENVRACLKLPANRGGVDS